MFLECKPYSWCALCCEWKLLIVEQFKWAYNPIRCNMTHQGRRNEFLKEVTRIAEIPPFAISVSDSSFHLMECYSFSSGWRSQKRFYFLVEWIFFNNFWVRWRCLHDHACRISVSRFRSRLSMPIKPLPINLWINSNFRWWDCCR